MLLQAYKSLERYTPRAVKRLIPERWRVWLGYQVKVAWRGDRPAAPPVAVNNAIAPVTIASHVPPPVPAAPVIEFDASRLMHRLELPIGETKESILKLLAQHYIKEDGPHPERSYYLEKAFMRFLYTLQITPRRRGRLLEIGAAPYFTSLLLHHFTSHELTLTNFFDPVWGKKGKQTLVDENGSAIPMEFDHFNIETDTFPYEGGAFDIVLFCEVLEHLTNDPYRALVEIHRVLYPTGALVLTTPNAARLQNVERIWAGRSVFDDYSAYGPYGRHNREYTLAEVERLLRHAGFVVEESFTSDIEPHVPESDLPRELEAKALQDASARGEYIFVRARATREAQANRPAWLYRSYPSNETGSFE